MSIIDENAIEMLPQVTSVCCLFLLYQFYEFIIFSYSFPVPFLCEVLRTFSLTFYIQQTKEKHHVYFARLSIFFSDSICY
jgi:hypothetical protein